MPKICYKPKRFTSEVEDLIYKCNQIMADYLKQGYSLTLRQLYYRLVAANIIPNTALSYKRLGIVVNEGRLAGLIDWFSIIDRTRNLQKPPSWDSPADILDACVQSYARDKWKDQTHRLEVWVEKDALIDVVGKSCEKWGIPYFSCRGYTSQSEMWGAAQRLLKIFEGGQLPVVVHLGDHDPSGVDMSRDITDRLSLFIGTEFDVNRIALNMNQVRKYTPPPNYAKVTDSRYASYIEMYGDECWELDALEPSVIDGLISTIVKRHMDKEEYDKSILQQEQERDRLKKLAHFERHPTRSKKVTNRFVVVNDDKGVYLGSTNQGVLWSNFVKDGSGESNAPTFSSKEEAAQMAASHEHFPPYHLALIFPDKPNDECSRECLRNHCLPTI